MRLSSTVSSDFFSVIPRALLCERAALTRAGSARRIAKMVGGIPAERRRIVLWFSERIL